MKEKSYYSWGKALELTIIFHVIQPIGLSDQKQFVPLKIPRNW